MTGRGKPRPRGGKGLKDASGGRGQAPQTPAFKTLSLSDQVTPAKPQSLPINSAWGPTPGQSHNVRKQPTPAPTSAQPAWGPNAITPTTAFEHQQQHVKQPTSAPTSAQPAWGAKVMTPTTAFEHQQQHVKQPTSAPTSAPSALREQEGKQMQQEQS